MARFVSRYAAFSHGVRPEESYPLPNGTRHVTVRLLEAQFDRRGLTEYEKELGEKQLRFHGLPEDRDKGWEVKPHSRMGLFDTERAKRELGWTDEEHDLVLNALRNSPQLGVDFIEVEQPKRPAPWKGYDALTDAEEIAELAQATDSVAEALAYERDNQKRGEVLDLLEELLPDNPDEQDIVIEA